jgi:hypothetical protein
VGKANGSRERAPDDELRVPTIQNHPRDTVGTARRAPLLTLRTVSNLTRRANHFSDYQKLIDLSNPQRKNILVVY